MLLSDRDIKQAIKDGQIIIKPIPFMEEALSACAIDLRLDYEFEVFEYSRLTYFDPRQGTTEQITKRISIKDGDAFILQP